MDKRLKNWFIETVFVIPILFTNMLGNNMGHASPEERQADVTSFVDEMVTKNGFERAALEAIMQKARFRQSIIDIMERPAEAKPWYEYREIFLTLNRINGGVKFWRTNEIEITHIAQQYGIPPEIIVAIIGVETRYGDNIGHYRVLDALSTLAFGYPKRAKYFRQELEELLLLSKEEVPDIITRTGSYAGAMGLPQFMPSSYRKYAVDADKDKHCDLWNSTTDILASVANYFREHGWHTGEPIAYKIESDVTTLQTLISKGNAPNKPSVPLTTATKQQIITIPPLNKAVVNPNALINLLSLEGDGTDEYWVGFHNFYVITRYNHSNNYAMAVYQLSQEILTAFTSTK